MILLKLEKESKLENSKEIIKQESLLTIIELICNNFKSR